jgi:histidinol-phosphate aminotransferase
MSAPVPLREELAAAGTYRSPQPSVPVRLNTNESPLPPPPSWQDELAEALRHVDFHRYPDRDATELRRGIAALHGVAPEEVFCANGSNEVLQCLLLAFGGAGRSALVFEPTYALHAHIARLTGTRVLDGTRGADLRIDAAHAVSAVEVSRPDVVFVCSPNNPTGQVEEPGVVRALVDRAPGLVVVDEAYAQFAGESALPTRASGGEGGRSAGLVVVRTFSKTWAMAGARLGYLVADPAVVAGCEAAALPYHLSAQTQVAGVLALAHAGEVAGRLAQVVEERGRLAAGLGALPVEVWPSTANFLLFRPLERPDGGDAAGAPNWLWRALLAEGVLVRDFSSKRGLEGCLRVTVGSAEENDRFLVALAGCLRCG